MCVASALRVPPLTPPQGSTITTVFEYLPIAAIVAVGLMIAARIITLARRGVRAVVVGVGRPLGERAFEATAFALLLFWVYLLAAYTDGRGPRWLPEGLDRRLFDATAAKWLGAAMLAAGVAVFALAMRAMGVSFRMGIDRAAPGSQAGLEPAALVTHGIFARSRNPIYLAFDLISLGSFAIHGRVVFLLAAIAMAAAFHVQILREERFLAAAYGDRFADYCNRARRYI